MHTLQPTAASSLALPPENYIYAIAACAPASFAAISSDDSLRVFDAASLDRVSVIAPKTHDGVTALRSYAAGDAPLLATGGREGAVKLWDVRARNAAVEMETGKFSSSALQLPLMGLSLPALLDWVEGGGVHGYVFRAVNPGADPGMHLMLGEFVLRLAARMAPGPVEM